MTLQRDNLRAIQRCDHSCAQLLELYNTLDSLAAHQHHSVTSERCGGLMLVALWLLAPICRIVLQLELLGVTDEVHGNCKYVPTTYLPSFLRYQ